MFHLITYKIMQKDNGDREPKFVIINIGNLILHKQNVLGSSSRALTETSHNQTFENLSTVRNLKWFDRLIHSGMLKNNLHVQHILGR
jgi:hypothetical protein